MRSLTFDVIEDTKEGFLPFELDVESLSFCNSNLFYSVGYDSKYSTFELAYNCRLVDFPNGDRLELWEDFEEYAILLVMDCFELECFELITKIKKDK